MGRSGPGVSEADRSGDGDSLYGGHHGGECAGSGNVFVFPGFVGVAEAAVAIAMGMFLAVDGVEILKGDGAISLETSVDGFEVGKRTFGGDVLCGDGEGFAQILFAPMMRDGPLDAGGVGSSDAFVDAAGGDVEFFPDLPGPQLLFVVHSEDILDTPGGLSHGLGRCKRRAMGGGLFCQ